MLLLGLCQETSERMIDAVKVSRENVVCEIEKLGRVIKVCIIFSVCFPFSFFPPSQELPIQWPDLRETSSHL